MKNISNPGPTESTTTQTRPPGSAATRRDRRVRLVTLVALALTVTTAAADPTTGIVRMNLDGSNVETILETDDFGPDAIALDTDAQVLYFTIADKLRRADSDGTNPTDILVAENPGGIAVDIAGGKIY